MGVHRKVRRINWSGIMSYLLEAQRSPPSQHTDNGPRLAQRHSVRWGKVAEWRWAKTEMKHGPNVGPITLAQRKGTIPISYIVSTLLQCFYDTCIWYYPLLGGRNPHPFPSSPSLGLLPLQSLCPSVPSLLSLVPFPPLPLRTDPKNAA